MQDFKSSIEQLNIMLAKHNDVKEVFRSAVRGEIEIEMKQRLLHSAETHMKAWRAFAQNISMLRTIKVDDTEENKGTRDVLDAIRPFYDYLETDSNILLMMFEDQDTLLLFIETSARLVLFCVNCQISRRISTLLNDDLASKREISDKTIYRGQSSVNYKLIPSLYRNISIDGGMGIINISKLENIYAKTKLRSKYKDVFGTDNVDYNFCAFAQHSKAYSPFLDFTDEINVALSFATGTTNSLNDYFKNNAALYSMQFDEIETMGSCSLSGIDIFINENKISPFTNIRNKALFLCTYRDFSVEAYILKDKTNDRMKYQKGCFLYIQRAVIINGNLLLPINFGRIKKYTIPATGKTLTKLKIYETIGRDHKYYLQEYLMNPYKYFEEAPL